MPKIENIKRLRVQLMGFLAFLFVFSPLLLVFQNCGKAFQATTSDPLFLMSLDKDHPKYPFLLPTKVKTVYEGDRIEISVELKELASNVENESLSKSIHWYFDDKELKTNAGAKKFVIDPALQKHQGIYSVKVRNAGFDFRLDAVDLTVLPASPDNEMPKFTSVPMGQSVNPGETIALHASAYGRPQPLITWYKDGVPIENAFGEILMLRNFQTQNVGDYWAQASNVVADVETPPARLQIGSSSETPRIILAPSNPLSVPLGSPYEIRFRASGLPTPVLTLKKENEVIPLSADGVLRRASTVQSDGGIYTLEAKNRIGFDEYSFELVVACPAGQHTENSVCVSNIKTCALTDGTGESVWNGTDYGPCNVVSCNPGFTHYESQCRAYQGSCNLPIPAAPNSPGVLISLDNRYFTLCVPLISAR